MHNKKREISSLKMNHLKFLPEKLTNLSIAASQPVKSSIRIN